MSYCGGCKQVILGKECLSALDRTWHPQCLRCTFCRTGYPLRQAFYSRYGLPYCPPCDARLWGHICDSCGLPIGDRVLKDPIKGGIYHFQCFSCSRCDGTLDPSGVVLHKTTRRILCAACAAIIAEKEFDNHLKATLYPEGEEEEEGERKEGDNDDWVVVEREGLEEDTYMGKRKQTPSKVISSVVRNSKVKIKSTALDVIPNSRKSYIEILAEDNTPTISQLDYFTEPINPYNDILRETNDKQLLLQQQQKKITYTPSKTRKQKVRGLLGTAQRKKKTEYGTKKNRMEIPWGSPITDSLSTKFIKDEKVTNLLIQINLEHIIPILEAEQIDYDTLMQLSDVDLKEIGIPFGPRKKLMDIILTQGTAPDITGDIIPIITSNDNNNYHYFNNERGSNIGDSSDGFVHFGDTTLHSSPPNHNKTFFDGKLKMARGGTWGRKTPGGYSTLYDE